eukprot:m.369528 g.369528  ORF g.369528 m.369528 type:complete len:64 (+) comp49831_c0_seq1:92-283(+)
MRNKPRAMVCLKLINKITAQRKSQTIQHCIIALHAHRTCGYASCWSGEYRVDTNTIVVVDTVG